MTPSLTARVNKGSKMASSFLFVQVAELGGILWDGEHGGKSTFEDNVEFRSEHVDRIQCPRLTQAERADLLWLLSQRRG